MEKNNTDNNETTMVENPMNGVLNHSETSKANALIVLGTRYGATTGTAKEIAKVLNSEGFDVKLVDVKKEEVKDIAEYELVIIGSGIQIDRWTKEAEGFLKRFKQELRRKKVALFVSSGTQALVEHEGNPEKIGRARRKYLDEKSAKYELHPISMRVFGGIWDFQKMPWWSRKAMAATRLRLEADRFQETRPGVYDTRNWEDIRNWAKELVKSNDNGDEMT